MRDTRIVIYTTAESRNAWQSAASDMDLDLSDWIRMTLHAALSTQIKKDLTQKADEVAAKDVLKGDWSGPRTPKEAHKPHMPDPEPEPEPEKVEYEEEEHDEELAKLAREVRGEWTGPRTKPGRTP